MVTKRVELAENVIQLARTRLKNIWGNGVPVYLGMSGGKDSIVLAHLVYTMIREGELDASRLRVVFIDEEAMFDEVIRIAQEWRSRFIKVGATFDWWCIEVKHFNCFNQLSNDESFICWDREARDRWVRPMPEFARTTHPLLRPRKDSYQEFLDRATADGITITGVRTAESLQRLQAFHNKPAGKRKMLKPIYDWKDTDVWMYIRDNNIDFPDTYMKLYQVGMGKRDMRLSQFFSIDTARVLVRLAEHEPHLMQAVIRREPNAYLATLYWDSELFRSTKERKQAREKGLAADVDYQAEVMRIIYSAEHGINSPQKSRAGLARNLRSTLLGAGGELTPEEWEEAHTILVAGDPKRRATRALYFRIAGRKTEGKRPGAPKGQPA